MAGAMVRSVRAVPGMDFVGVASHDIDRAKRFAQVAAIPGAYDSVADLAARPEVDALYVATRTADHFAAAMAAIAAGKPVLVEKPLAASLDEARTLVAVARNRGCLLMENQWCLALPAYRRLAAGLAGGNYGDPVHLTFAFGYPVSRASYPSLFDPADGGVLRDRGVYGVALAVQLLGPVRGVQSALQRDATGVEIAAALQLQHQTGATSHVAVALNALLSNTATLACTGGLLHLGAPVIGSESLSRQHMTASETAADAIGGQGGLLERIKAIPLARRLSALRSPARHERLSYGAAPYVPVLEHFRAAVQAGAAESDLVPLDLSIAVQEVLEAARHDQGRV